MAHIYDIAEKLATNVTPSYKDGKKANPRIKFPETPVFQGFNAPTRIETDISNLEVTGIIPEEIDGTFYRIQPDHRFPPIFEDDIHFNGDGSVTAIRLEQGYASIKQRYVHTERYKLETDARKALFGRYRNPYTDNEAVNGVIRTAANTNITFWRGVLLAAKEDGPNYAMDPVTLETIGRYDFDGQINVPTMTAHPKIDPETGELVCFAYEASGNGNDGNCDVVVWTIDKDGKKTEESWYKAPFCGMIHDCGISKNYVVLPMTPMKCNPERLKKGGNHWAWDPEEDQLYGLVPRRGGKPEDIIWFRAPNAFHGHTAGCYEDESGNVVFDCTNADGNVFFFFPPDNQPSGVLGQRQKLSSPTVRWTFDPRTDPKSNPRAKPTLTLPLNGEFSRIDDRWVTKPYEHFWQVSVDPTRFYDGQKCGAPAGGLFNCIGHFTWSEPRVEDVYWAGPCSTFQEPTFIPKARPNSSDPVKEGEGWIIALVNRLDVLRNDICIFDAMNVAKGPVATVHLPLRLRLGLHGNFVDRRDIVAWEERRKEGGDLGPAKAAEGLLPWQEKALGREIGTNGNGVNGNGNGIHGSH